jgi:hypothetical protein
VSPPGDASVPCPPHRILAGKPTIYEKEDSSFLKKRSKKLLIFLAALYGN